MSFESSAAHSVRANRALARGRNRLFDRNVDLKTRQQIAELPQPTKAVREKNRRRLAAEKARERKAWIITILITAVIGIAYFAWALPSTH